MNESQFSDSQFDDAYPDDIGDHYWSRARNLILYDAVKSISKQQKRWLEIGCGRGVVIGYLRGRGVLIEGVELADVKPLASVANFVLSGFDLSDLPQLQRDVFNGVMLLDVIEHIEDSGAFLRTVRDQMRKAQVLIVTVPARPELWSNYDTHYGHFRRYSRESLRNELVDAGWKPLRVSYLFRALYPPAWLLVKFMRQRSTTVKSPQAGNGLLHRFVGAGLWLESRLPFGAIRGTSVIAVAIRA